MPRFPTNLAQLVLDRLSATPDRDAIRFRQDGELECRTWREFADEVYQVAGALLASGVSEGSRVAQLAENRYEWILVDLAIYLCQAVHVPIHAPLAGPQVLFQIQHSGAEVLFVSNAAQLEKLVPLASQLPRGLRLIAFDAAAESFALPRPETWTAWLQTAAPGESAPDAARVAARTVPADAVATILYTSGTTGQPKGVMLSHHNLVTNSCSTVWQFGMRPNDVRLCFLPLSHIFARTCDLYTWLVTGSELCLATSRETVLLDCQWARPTIISGVPYFYDRLYRVLQEQGIADDPDSLRQLLGGRIEFCSSGGAALADPTFDFFQRSGIPLLQGYGLTETSPVITLSTPEAYRRGSAGQPLPGVEVALAEDGEIITRGPHVMKGYWQDPAATAECLRDGWFYTGDLGRIDDDQFVWITGRKKELIVTAAGKNIAPVWLESLLCEDPLIEQAMVIGDNRNYLAALIVPNWEALQRQLPHLNLSGDDPGRRLQPQTLQLIQAVIERRLSCVSHHEQVRKFALLDRPFSIERHELTPKLSLRRSIIREHYRAEIQAMYGSSEPTPPASWDN